MVSFSVTKSNNEDNRPYALFGGFNSSQILGGSSGLKTFKNFPNWLGTWALKGEGVFYDGVAIQNPESDAAYPAIIDTGSSQLSIPPNIFENLRKEWKKQAADLECGQTFCHSGKQCSELQDILHPVAFQLSDYVFEMSARQYLFQDTDKNRCYMLIHKCTLPGQNAYLFLIGDVFLRNFYSVYDFEKDQVGLGINIHSKGKVHMYKPG